MDDRGNVRELGIRFDECLHTESKKLYIEVIPGSLPSLEDTEFFFFLFFCTFIVTCCSDGLARGWPFGGYR